jgi:hypothetical protein
MSTTSDDDREDSPGADASIDGRTPGRAVRGVLVEAAGMNDSDLVRLPKVVTRRKAHRTPLVPGPIQEADVPVRSVVSARGCGGPSV